MFSTGTGKVRPDGGHFNQTRYYITYIIYYHQNNLSLKAVLGKNCLGTQRMIIGVFGSHFSDFVIQNSSWVELPEKIICVQWLHYAARHSCLEHRGAPCRQLHCSESSETSDISQLARTKIKCASILIQIIKICQFRPQWK